MRLTPSRKNRVADELRLSGSGLIKSKTLAGRTMMEWNSARWELPEVLSEQQVSDQLIKRIRKLHWIGLEREAERLRMALGYLIPADSVLANPRDTD